LVSLLTWISHGIVRWTGGKSFTGRMFGNREELRLVMLESAQGFTSEERSMINRVLDFQNLTVRHATIPLEQVVTASASTPLPQVLNLCRERSLTRLLVEQLLDGHRKILGLLSLKNVLYLPELDLNKAAGDYVKPALFLDEHLPLETALRRMQRSGQRLAIVLGRDQREVGIVSLQDILKAIFGEITF
jgi:CBS domain containing-hemolysin-like protein